MTKLAFSIIVNVLFSTMVFGQNCTTSTTQWFGGTVNCPDDPYKLVFHDEFDGNSLDLSKWYTYYPYGNNNSDQHEFCRTHGDNEAQIYQDDNVVLQNGVLKLTAEQENATWYSATRQHTSGMIHSKQNFLYGKFEIRCKVPSGSGFWPAFWLWGLDECDVFEICGHNTSELNTNLHMDCDNEHFQTPQSHSTPDLSASFHTFSVEWEPLYVDWRLDGNLIRRIYRLTTVAGNNVECGDDLGVNTLVWNEMIPNEYMSVIANLAISPNGSYCGSNGLNASTPFPSSFEIDYIRVYQKTPQTPQDGDGLVDSCSQNQINGQDEICSTSSQTYAFNGSNSVNNWTVSSNLTILSSNANSITVAPINLSANGSAWIKANFDQYKPCSLNQLTKNIWIGKPIVKNILGPRFGCTQGELFGVVSGINFQSIQYQWQISGGAIVSGQGTSSIIVDPIDGPYGFTAKLRAENSCGCSDWFNKFFPTDCNGDGGGFTMQLVVFPNPAANHISVVTEQNMTISKGFLVQNNTGVIEELEFQNFSAATFSLDGKEEGVYHILILTDENELIATESFIINNQ